MAFSVSTSWLLPMNDRLHVKVGLDLSGEDYQANIARLGAYLGTLPEYSLVDVVVKHHLSHSHLSVLYCIVRYGPGYGYGSLPLIPNALSLDSDLSDMESESFVDGVGYRIPARDVPHAVVRAVPDMTEIRTQDDLDHFGDEMAAIEGRVRETLQSLAEILPDGSLLDEIVPGGSPDPGSGALADYRIRYIVYGRQKHELPAEAEYVPPHLPGQSGGGNNI